MGHYENFLPGEVELVEDIAKVNEDSCPCGEAVEKLVADAKEAIANKNFDAIGGLVAELKSTAATCAKQLAESDCGKKLLEVAEALEKVAQSKNPVDVMAVVVKFQEAMKLCKHPSQKKVEVIRKLKGDCPCIDAVQNLIDDLKDTVSACVDQLENSDCGKKLLGVISALEKLKDSTNPEVEVMEVVMKVGEAYESCKAK